MRSTIASVPVLLVWALCGSSCGKQSDHRPAGEDPDAAGPGESPGNAGGTLPGQGGSSGTTTRDAGATTPGQGGSGGQTSRDAAGDGGGVPDGMVPDGAVSSSSDARGDVAAITDGGAPGVGGPSRCATAGTALCEDFENGITAAIWHTQKANGNLGVDGVHAARGTRALHLTVTSGPVYIWEAKTFPALKGGLYGRMFLWFDNTLTRSHFTLAESSGTGAPDLVRFGGQGGAFGVGSDRGASGDWTDNDGKAISSKRWYCVEFQFDGATSEFHVWVDGAERTRLHSGANKHPGFKIPQMTSLWFGYWNYNSAEPQSLWMDEIAVDSKPIGCDR